MYLFSFLCTMSTIVLILCANILHSVFAGSAALLLLWICFLVYVIKRWREYLLVCLFLICFFSFLLGTYVTEILNVRHSQFTIETDLFIINMIYLSLVFLWLGCRYGKSIKMKVSNDRKDFSISPVQSAGALRKPAFILFWMTFPFYFSNIIARNVFVKQYGYLEYFKSYTGVSSIITYGNIACMFFFYLYLACFPKKKFAVYPIGAYLIANIFSILGGSRSTMVVAFVFVIYYFLLRDRNDKEGKGWINKSYIKWGIFVLPFFMAFLGYWAYYRTDTIQTNMNVLDYFFNFIELNGNSGSIIGYAYDSIDTLKKLGRHSYTFGYIVRLVNNLNYAQSSVDVAYSGTSLGASITYMMSPYTFLRGGGYGTCYIAELWTDFGVIGVAVYNFLLGLILTKLAKFRTTDTFLLLLSFVVIQNLLVLPRSEALCMIPNLTSGIFIFLFVSTMLYSGLSKDLAKPFKHKITGD